MAIKVRSSILVCLGLASWLNACVSVDQDDFHESPDVIAASCVILHVGYDSEENACVAASAQSCKNVNLKYDAELKSCVAASNGDGQLNSEVIAASCVILNKGFDPDSVSCVEPSEKSCKAVGLGYDPNEKTCFNASDSHACSDKIDYCKSKRLPFDTEKCLCLEVNEENCLASGYTEVDKADPTRCEIH